MAAENPMIAINRGGGRRVGTMQPLSGDNMGLLSSSSSHEGVAQELGLLLKGKSRHESILSKRDPLPHRSGSAPPIVEGSLAPMGQIFGSASTQQGNYFTPSGPTEGLDVVESELELRSDPAYLAYYYTHVKLNPRLPPPIISRESYWHAQHFVTSGMGERQKMGSNEGSGSKFPFPPQSGLSTHKEEMEPEPENVEEGGNFNKQVTDDWTDNNAAESLTGLLGGYGVKPKCLVDLIQEDFPRTPSPIYNLSRSSSRAANEDGTENAAEPSLLHTHSPVPNSGSVRVNSSNGPGRAASAPAGIKGVAQVQSIIAPDAGRNSANVAELCAALQEASVAEGKEREQAKHPTTSFPSQSQSQSASFQPASSQNIYAAMSHMAARNPFYQNLQPAALYASQYGLGSYPPSPNLTPTLIAGYPALPMGYDNAANLGAAMPFLGSSRGISGSFDPQQLYKYIGHAGNAMQSQLPDLMYLQYLQQQHSTGDARSYTSGNHIDPYDLHKSHAGGFTPDKKSQYPRTGSSGMPIVTKSGSVSPAAYYSSAPGVGYMIPYPSSPISSPVLPGSPVIPGSFSLRQTEINYQTPFGVGRSTAPYGWQSQRGSSPSEELMCFSLLEEMKTNKTRRFELLDIVGHVVEFSSDQHGSRFIQQKLETATAEEKAMVFREVLPQVLTLVTDVFGNYVIQKFFEHGITDQIAEIANQLVGHVLNLSLQMYGCRVIQKALEVVDVEQQTKLVSELDGHVIHCVRDQNGNHVIQKCIECIPADKIGFIISAFSGQVVVLSTHPYGCRVIQRVLEHCTDEQKGCGIMEEILHSACSLAQDQYGNYVVQHVLEHGSPRVRTELITKLVGQIVQMSHNKFASNVVEKCLEFGGVVGRQLLIAEMLGTTEENEVLQAMMKDQFANYVVQKVLEICDEDERKLLLSRIRVHLPALKKYTYGKHIVARVEKLLVTGEQRDAQVSH